MKKLLLALGTAIVLGGSLPAQEESPGGFEPTVATMPRFDNVQLDQLLGPIALYPDALIALILPASTVPSDVVLAARYLRDGGDAAQLEAQAWDDSVRALAHYPDVVKWMDENLAWTKQLGEAFAAQPTDVMNAVQRLRLKARAVGNLVDTPQQQVVVDQSAISIVPAQPDVIYVPYYDPEVVYISRPTYYTRPLFSFGPAFASGFWLSYNVDWHRRRVWCVDRPHRETHWRDHRNDWHRPSHHARTNYTSRPGYYRTWAPRPTYGHSGTGSYSRYRTTVVRPSHGNGNSSSHYNRPRENANESRWDKNYTRPPGATGERFPTPPSRGPHVPRFSSPTPALPLADPLPHAAPSPLPNSQTAVNPPSNRGSSRIGQRGQDYRNSGNQNRIDPGSRADRSRGHGSYQNARPVVNAAPNPAPTPTPSASPSHASSGRSFHSRPGNTSSPPPIATTAPVSYSRNSSPPPPAEPPAASSRSSETRQESPRGSSGNNLNGGRFRQLER